MGSLHSVTNKISWAEKHREEIKAEITRYFEQSAGRIVAEVNTQLYGSGIVRFMGPDVPESVSYMIGDCLQNLRSALDYLVWELCLAANGTPTENNAFPICESSESFKRLRARRLQGIADEAATQIELLQPYHREQYETDPLWILNKLTNVSKHRRLLVSGLNVLLLDPVALPHESAPSETGVSDNVQMDEGLVAVVEFKETQFEGREVVHVLRWINDYLIDAVTPQSG